MKVRRKAPASIIETANPKPPAALSVEKHYSVPELAEIWNLSENTIRRIFEHEPGVLKFGTKERRRARRYTTIRIPETVVFRVHRQLRATG